MRQIDEAIYRLTKHIKIELRIWRIDIYNIVSGTEGSDDQSLYQSK